MTGDDCDVLMSLAQRQQRGGELGLGCRPDDEGLSADERAVLARFEAKVEEVTGVKAHASDGRAVFKLSTAETGCPDSSDDEEESGRKNVRVPDVPLGLHGGATCLPSCCRMRGAFGCRVISSSLLE